MNSLDPILVIDVNVIIHFEKAGLLDVLVNDKNIRIVASIGNVYLCVRKEKVKPTKKELLCSNVETEATPFMVSYSLPYSPSQLFTSLKFHS